MQEKTDITTGMPVAAGMRQINPAGPVYRPGATHMGFVSPSLTSLSCAP